jgi:AraC-like DNA-binding protein
MDLRAGGNARFGSTFDTLNVLMPRKVLAVLADQIGSPPPHDLREPVAWTTRDPVIESLEQGLLHAISAGPTMDQLVGDHLNLALVTHIAIRYGGMRKPSPSLLGTLARWQLQRATEIMASNLGQRVSLVNVARHCDVSPSHFSRAFKASTGLTPSSWMLRLRIDRAKDLLRQSGASLAEVASRCGFADQAHFTRTFSRYLGVSPGAWRRAHRRF